MLKHSARRGTIATLCSLSAACAVLLCGCWSNPLGLYDQETCPTFQTKPLDTLVSGSYDLDSSSMRYFETLGFPNTGSFRLRLDSTGHATCDQFPIANVGSFEFDSLIRLEATWNYVLSQGDWNQIELHPDSLGGCIAHLCSKNGRTSLFFHSGDPDAGKGVFYRKVAEN